MASDDRGPRGPSALFERLRRVAAGDRDAVAWLYDTYAPALHRRLRRRYERPGGPDPGDLLHDAFVFFLQRDAKALSDFAARTPDDERAAAALERHLWDLACGVAANRRRSAWARRVLPLLGLDPASPAASPDRAAEARERLARLDDCLKDGSGRVYLYYKLRYFDGLTPEEISGATGWSRKASYKLKDALNQAVRRCAERLGLAS